MLVILLLQVNGVALKSQSDESNHSHNLRDELNERNIEWFGGVQ